MTVDSRLSKKLIDVNSKTFHPSMIRSIPISNFQEVTISCEASLSWTNSAATLQYFSTLHTHTLSQKQWTFKIAK